MANYKKIRDLSNFVNITPDHLVPVSTPLGAGSESTGHTTAKSFFGSVINNSVNIPIRTITSKINSRIIC